MDKPQNETTGVVPAWMQRWGVSQAWTFDVADVGGDHDEHGVVVAFGDGRTRGYYLLSEMEVDLAESLGIRVAMLTRGAVDELEDAWRRESIERTMRPIRPLASEASHAA